MVRLGCHGSLEPGSRGGAGSVSGQRGDASGSARTGSVLPLRLSTDWPGDWRATVPKVAKASVEGETWLSPWNVLWLWCWFLFYPLTLRGPLKNQTPKFITKAELSEVSTILLGTQSSPSGCKPEECGPENPEIRLQ